MAGTYHHSGKLDTGSNANAVERAARIIAGNVRSRTSEYNINPIVAEGRAILDNIVSSVQGAFGSAVSTATAALAKLYYSGTTGNFESALENIECTLTYFDISEDNSDNIGSPCRKRLVLTSLSGFCQCEGAKVELGCTEVEQQAVETFLNTGVFLE